jgi:hypothetical protein
LFKAHSVLALKSLRPQQGVDQVTQQPGSDERGERNPAPSIDRRSENIEALIPHYTEIQVAQHLSRALSAPLARATPQPRCHGLAKRLRQEAAPVMLALHDL